MFCLLLVNTMSQFPCPVSFWWTWCPSSCPNFCVLSPFDEHGVPVHVPISVSCLLLMNTVSQFMSQFLCSVFFWWTRCPSSFPFGQFHHQQFCIFFTLILVCSYLFVYLFSWGWHLCGWRPCMNSQVTDHGWEEREEYCCDGNLYNYSIMKALCTCRTDSIMKALCTPETVV